jgi:hypothetical protein
MEWTHGGSSHLERSVPQTKDPIIFPGKQEVGIPLWIFLENCPVGLEFS